MKKSDFIVAINKDKDAPIGEIADVLVVADVHAVCAGVDGEAGQLVMLPLTGIKVINLAATLNCKVQHTGSNGQSIWICL